MRLPNLGLAIRCFGRAENYVKQVQAAEEADFKSVWLVEVRARLLSVLSILADIIKEKLAKHPIFQQSR